MASSPDWALAALGGARVLFVMAVGQEFGPHLAARFRPLFTGVGPIEAALATGLALASLDPLPDLVVSLGSAGSRRCPLGTVRQVSAVSWRDMDASRLGFARGVTPFLDRPAIEPLPTPLSLPTATLATGSTIVGGDDYAAIDADLVDMETYAVLRACQRFGVPLIGLRGVSDGPGELHGVDGWTALLAHLDEALAAAVDELASVLAANGGRAP
jgi:adenosylhomocysteine nucleosidase